MKQGARQRAPKHLQYAALMVVPGGLLVGGCVRSPPPPDNVEQASRILTAAARVLREPEAVTVHTLMARAVVTGPSGTFATTVWSARDGRARMEQTTGFTAGVNGNSVWLWNSDADAADPADAETRQYLRGHELHALVLFPAPRLVDPVFTGRAVWDGDSALVVRLRDETGAEVLAAFAASDTLPLGLQITSTDPDVFVRFAGWEWRGGVRVFTRATFRQETEVYRYEYTDVVFNAADDAVFEPPG